MLGKDILANETKDFTKHKHTRVLYSSTTPPIVGLLLLLPILAALGIGNGMRYGAPLTLSSSFASSVPPYLVLT
jgi:hypothetical protein